MPQVQQQIATASGTNTALVTAPANPAIIGPSVNDTAQGLGLQAVNPTSGAIDWASDGTAMRVKTSAGYFVFWQDCIIFPNGQMICGENLPSGILTQPTPVPGAPPSITAPTNGATNISLTTRISWLDTLPATGFQLQVSTDPAFGSTAIDITTGYDFYDVPGGGTFLGGTLYYARVRETTPTASDWSAIVGFTTVAIHAAQFNGTNIQLQTATEVVFGSGDFTIMVWFATEGTSPRTYAQFWNSGYAGGATDLEVGLYDNQQFVYGDARSSFGPPIAEVYIRSPSSYDTHGWHHAAFVRNGGVFTLYVDGGLVASAIPSPVIGNVDSGMGAVTVIGNGQNSINTRWLAAHLSDLRAYNSAISQADIISIYSAGIGAYPALGSPVLWLKMDEGTGSVAHDSVGGNDATFTGTPPYWS